MWARLFGSCLTKSLNIVGPSGMEHKHFSQQHKIVFMTTIVLSTLERTVFILK